MKILCLALLAVFSVADGFAQEPTAPRRRVGTLGAFIDDAEATERGYLIYGVSTSYRRGLNNEDFDYVANDISYGLHRRVSLEASFPISNSRFEGNRVHALGDFYFSAKLIARPPDKGVGVAFEPMLEVLGKSSLFRNDFPPTRVNAVLPIILQRSFDRFRIYGEAGYITRGTLFLSAAIDGTFAKRWGSALIVSCSRAVKDQELNRELNYNIARCDAVVGVYYRVNDRLAIFANGGRTISRIDVNSALYQATLGFTITQKVH